MCVLLTLIICGWTVENGWHITIKWLDKNRKINIAGIGLKFIILKNDLSTNVGVICTKYNLWSQW